MSNIGARIDRLETASGVGVTPVIFLLPKARETKEQCFARTYPGQSYPAESEARVVVVMWLDSPAGGF